MGNKEQMVKIHQHAMKNQKKALINKACEWMKLRLVARIGSEDAHEFLTEFRKAMEE